MHAGHADYGKWRFSSSLALLTGHIFSIQYATMPHKLVFAGIDLVMPNCTCIILGYTEKTLKFFLRKLKYTSTAIFPCLSFPFLLK